MVDLLPKQLPVMRSLFQPFKDGYACIFRICFYLLYLQNLCSMVNFIHKDYRQNINVSVMRYVTLTSVIHNKELLSDVHDIAQPVSHYYKYTSQYDYNFCIITSYPYHYINITLKQKSKKQIN